MLPTAARIDTDTAPAGGRLLVWIGNSAEAELLVRHAAQLAAASRLPWTVMTVETPRTARQVPGQREFALRALELADRLGATTDQVHADSVLAAVAERARRDQTTTVLIGGADARARIDRLGRRWLDGLAAALGDRLPGVTIHAIHFPERPAGPGRVSNRAAPSQRRAWVATLAIVLLCTAIADLLLPGLELADVAMVYLAGVVVVALRYGRSASVLAVVSSILLFDLIFVPPRWGFHPTEPKYFFTFGVMLIVGLLISRLVDHARLQARVAEARARRAQALNELASHLATARTEQAVADGLDEVLQATFPVRAAMLVPGDDGRLRPLRGVDGPDVAGEGGAIDGLAEQAFTEGRSTGADTEIEHGAAALYLPLQGSSGTLGVLRIEPMPQRFGATEDRHLLHAFANQTAVALERSLFQRRSTEAVVAAEAQKLRNTLLSGISHDFRTPLTTIVGSATTLLQQGQALGERQRRMLLDSVLDEARRMHAGMSDILELTRMEEGALEPACEWCPADELVEEAREALGARLHEHRLEADVAPETVVWCDARLIQKVLVNLIDNAVCHTPPHTTISVHIDSTPGHWQLVVADNGPGLPAGREQEMLGKFVRGQREPARTGTGLGLALCAAVAELHQGRISAANAPGGGARLTLTLPQPVARDLPVDEAA